PGEMGEGGAPRLVAAIPGLTGNRIPAPAVGAGPGVEGADNAPRRLDGAIVAVGVADDDEVSDDGRRRSHLVLSVERRAGGRLEVDEPADAEAGGGAARGGGGRRHGPGPRTHIDE